MEAAKVINDYIRNVENKLTAAFLSILFPKLYGCPAEQMIDKNLIDTDKYLENSSGLIDAINAYSKQGKQKIEQPEETIEVPEETTVVTNSTKDKTDRIGPNNDSKIDSEEEAI